MELDIQIRKSVGDIAIIAQLASAEPMSFASPPAPNSIIEVPIVPGIMPCINAAQIKRMVDMCGAKFPEKFKKIVHRYGDDKEALFDAGMSYCQSQIIELLANDVEGIHLYTMNNVKVAKRLTEGIKNLI